MGGGCGVAEDGKGAVTWKRWTVGRAETRMGTGLSRGKDGGVVGIGHGEWALDLEKMKGWESVDME